MSTPPPPLRPDDLTPARGQRPGFWAVLVLGVLIGFGAGVLVGTKGCPPVPVPGATGTTGGATGTTGGAT